MLVTNHVSAVFHGHDHQYAYEKLDAVVYQSLPAAGFSGNGFSIYSENDPLTIRVLPSPGHLRVSITPVAATVDYISSNTSSNGQVSYSYNINPFQNGPLPVEMEWFTIQTENNKKVVLKWKTASEFMNKQFIVQRTIAGSADYKKIGIVAATNLPQGANYSFMDEPGLNGTYLYRLIQEDMDGKQKYSETRLAKLNGNKLWQITDNGTSWLIRSNQLINYSLMDMQGRLIEKGSLNGTKYISKPLNGGIYMLKTDCNGEIITQKLIR
jgi:hypothetical protein